MLAHRTLSIVVNGNKLCTNLDEKHQFELIKFFDSNDMGGICCCCSLGLCFTVCVAKIKYLYWTSHTEQPSVYAIQSTENHNSETKTSQSVIEEQLPSDLDNASNVNEAQESTGNT